MKNIVELVLDICHSKKNDLDGFDIILDHGNSLSISAQNNKIDKYNVSSSQVIGVRTLREGHVGISYSEDFSKESLTLMVDHSIEMMKFTEADKTQFIEHKENNINDQNDKTYREDTTSIEEKIKLALELESKMKGMDNRIQSVPYNGYSEGEGHRYYANSMGLVTYEKEKRMSCYTSNLMRDGEKQSMCYKGTSARVFSDLKVESIYNDCLEKGSLLLEGKSVPTGKYDIIFDTDTLSSFLGCFTGLFSGNAAKEGITKFKDSLEQKIAHQELSIIDSPKFKDGFNYSFFDDEGFAKNETTILQNGILKTFYHNSKTAKYFNTQNTFHASRSPKGHLGVSLNQLVIQKGSATDLQLHSNLYLKIIGLDGLHSGTNSISGNFSLAANGMLMEGDQMIQPVKGITISGNFFDLLNQIVFIGNSIDSNSEKTFFSPVIRFSDVSVAG